ncbi:MerR family transcriptional regulator [Streptomyces sp. NPDC095602]|uniref:MerR family transcriptional regulator n=1 Tax=Streptomyces sp. NPDC095602 TaxID=3155819 RepID=UPI003333A3DE
MPTTWLTAAEAAAHATRARRLLSAGAAAVTERTIRSWVARGHLTPTGLDDAGRQLFTLPDVARAELTTRRRALRLVGITEPAHTR